eukprot:1371296-Amorphochlora_amoeboformis.AAC.1
MKNICMYYNYAMATTSTFSDGLKIMSPLRPCPHPHLLLPVAFSLIIIKRKRGSGCDNISPNGRRLRIHQHFERYPPFHIQDSM